MDARRALGRGGGSRGGTKERVSPGMVGWSEHLYSWPCVDRLCLGRACAPTTRCPPRCRLCAPNSHRGVNGISCGVMESSAV
jgi:hypothetical protein